jgi:hypothetical protein
MHRAILPWNGYHNVLRYSGADVCTGRASRGPGPGRAGPGISVSKTGRAGPKRQRAGPGRTLKVRPVHTSGAQRYFSNENYN